MRFEFVTKNQVNHTCYVSSIRYLISEEEAVRVASQTRYNDSSVKEECKNKNWSFTKARGILNIQFDKESIKEQTSRMESLLNALDICGIAKGKKHIYHSNSIHVHFETRDPEMLNQTIQYFLGDSKNIRTRIDRLVYTFVSKPFTLQFINDKDIIIKKVEHSTHYTTEEEVEYYTNVFRFTITHKEENEQCLYINVTPQPTYSEHEDKNLDTLLLKSNLGGNFNINICKNTTVERAIQQISNALGVHSNEIHIPIFKGKSQQSFIKTQYTTPIFVQYRPISSFIIKPTINREKQKNVMKEQRKRRNKHTNSKPMKRRKQHPLI